MMKKVYIVRDFDISDVARIESGSSEWNLERRLEEYGSAGFSISATFPVFNDSGEHIAYRFIFVRDDDEDED